MGLNQTPISFSIIQLPFPKQNPSKPHKRKIRANLNINQAPERKKERIPMEDLVPLEVEVDPTLRI